MEESERGRQYDERDVALILKRAAEIQDGSKGEGRGRLTLEEVRDHFFAAGIAKQKTPERLSILPELPRNASGKILKHQLRDQA